jgi:hypothetical protein
MENQIEENVNISLQSKNKWYNNMTNNNETNYNDLDVLLEKEKIYNKTETWNKLDKTEKIQKLHAFSEKYGKQNNYSTKDIKLLKQFFIDCLEKAKLQKTKEVVYDKEAREIVSVPSLSFNPTSKNFTLRIMDPKRVSTLKSLTPKRMLQDKTVATESSSSL